MKSLVLGGVKSGKSRFAEGFVKDWVNTAGCGEEKVIYLATAESRNDEFSKRIERHREQRPTGWITIEEPLDIASVIDSYSRSNSCVLVECLTLWMSNLLLDEANLEKRVENLLRAVEEYQGEIILVSNETGMGIMPVNELARRFGDEIGVLHQKLAERCNRVVLTVAGLPHYLKQ